MLPAQRKENILRGVSQRGALQISELAEELNVSEVTIRRDIDQLVERGLVAKVHGGVTSLDFSITQEPAFSTTSLKEMDAKRAIAAAACPLIHAGQAIALMGGSTVYSLAEQLRDIPALTVVTNSLPVFELYSDDSFRKDWTVVLAGGERTPTNSLVGAVTEQAFQSFNFDAVVLGTFGMDIRGGFSSPNMLEADVNRRVIERSKTTIVLADHTKWGLRGFTSFAPLDSADIVVVDSGLDAQSIDSLEEHVGSVVVAEEGHQ